MSGQPKKNHSVALNLRNPPKTSAHTPQRAPTHRCTVTVWCSGALCSVLVQPTVREPRASVGAAAAPAHCARPPPLRVVSSPGALCSRPEAARGPQTGRPRRVRTLPSALYGLQVLLLLSGALISHRRLLCATVDIPFPKSRCTPYEQQRLMLRC